MIAGLSLDIIVIYSPSRARKEKTMDTSLMSEEMVRRILIRHTELSQNQWLFSLVVVVVFFGVVIFLNILSLKRLKSISKELAKAKESIK